MKKNTILFILLLSIISCGKVKKKVTLDKNNKNSENYIVNEKLALTLENEFKTISKSENFTTTEKTLQNTHDKSIIDTIRIYKFQDSEIKIYYARNKDLLTSARIYNSDLSLGEISIGMSKKVVSEKLNIEIISNKIKIGTIENSIITTFYFENEKLELIEFHSKID